MPYLGYLLAQAVKAGQTVASAITSASSYVTRVGGSVVELSASAEALKSPSSGSAVFNGASYIQLDTPLISGTQDFSISAWINAKVVGSGRTILASYGTTNSGGFQFYISPFGISVYINGYVSATYSTANEWRFVTATRESNAVKLYIDGSVAASGTLSNSVSEANARIGSNTSNGEYFNGNLANVAVWSRALSAEEVRSVMMKSYDDLSASETKGLVSWYALDDISGTTVPDSHGNFPATAY